MDNLIAAAWKNYRILCCGSIPLKAASDDVLALISVLGLVTEQLRGLELSGPERRSLRDLENGCDLVLEELEEAVSGSRLNHGLMEDVAGIRSKLVEQANALMSFFENLRSRSQAKILNILDQIREIKSEEFQESIAKDWRALQSELQRLGLNKGTIEAEFFFIENWLQQNYPSEDEEVEEESLPDYFPGARKGTIEEKVQALEQTTLILTTAPTEAIASSSKAEPPPYTFEAGSDNLFDDKFSKYIQTAIRNHEIFRMSQRQRDPDMGPNPWGWLPAGLQTRYRYSQGIKTAMDANSFSVMTYETVPRALEETERLKRLLQTSFDHKKIGGDGIVGESFKSLEVMTAALSKFAILQDQTTGLRFSDLDTLDYECNTAIDVNIDIDFPEAEFELARKSCYQLLTYIMGFLNAFTELYPGRTYVTRTPEELDLSWKALKMSSRVAWVEKQLVRWGLVERAIVTCRDFHRLRPSLRTKALANLQNWQKSEQILAGAEDGLIELRIISASGLPKSAFRVPNTSVKVVIYCRNKFRGAMRLAEYETAVASKTQNPVWNQIFLINAPRNSKMLHMEVYDHVAITKNEITRVKLDFTSVEGFEPCLADRSLMYSFDEEIDFPLMLNGGKGKEKEPPTLRVGLRWTGRRAKVEENGFPLSPPGKMFSRSLVRSY